MFLFNTPLRIKNTHFEILRTTPQNRSKKTNVTSRNKGNPTRTEDAKKLVVLHTYTPANSNSYNRCFLRMLLLMVLCLVQCLCGGSADKDSEVLENAVTEST